VRSSWIRALGGWDEDSIAEDNDLAVRLMCRGGKVSLAPVKVGVEAPSKLSTFIKRGLDGIGGRLKSSSVGLKT